MTTTNQPNEGESAGGGFSSLIDIGTPSPSSKTTESPFADFSSSNNQQQSQTDVFGNTTATQTSGRGGGAAQEQLIDPFASLATGRAEPPTSGNTTQNSSSDDILLNFGLGNDDKPGMWSFHFITYSLFFFYSLHIKSLLFYIFIIK